MKITAEFRRRSILIAVMIPVIAVVASPVCAQTGDPSQDVLVFTGHGGWPTGLRGPVRGVTFSPDGSRIASGGRDRIVRVWDAIDGRELLALKGHSYQVETVEFSPDGQWLASGSDDLSVKIWDAASGEEIHTMVGHSSHVLDVAFSPNGERIASAALHDRTVNVWDVASGEAVFSLEGPPEWIESVAFSPDGNWLAAGGQNGTVQLWDATNGAESITLTGHVGVVRGLSFSPDSAQLASICAGKISVWDIESGQEIVTLVVGGMLFDVAFSPDGKRLATCSSGATVTEWDIASGLQTLSLTAQADRQTADILDIPNGSSNFVYAVAYRFDSSQLAAASSDGLVRVWNLPPIP